MNWASSREKHPKPHTIPGVPHSLEFPEKFPTPETRPLCILSPLLICSMTITLSFNHIQRQTACLDLSSITRASPAHTSHTRMNFQTQQNFSRISLACPLVLSPEQLSWSSTARSHRNSHQATQTSVLRTTKSSILALQGPQYVLTVPLLPLPLTLTPSSGSCSQPSPRSECCLSSRAKETPVEHSLS